MSVAGSQSDSAQNDTYSARGDEASRLIPDIGSIMQ